MGGPRWASDGYDWAEIWDSEGKHTWSPHGILGHNLPIWDLALAVGPPEQFELGIYGLRTDSLYVCIILNTSTN